MEKKELTENLYSDAEMEDLEKTISVLKEQKNDIIQSKLPSNVDRYAIDYVKTLDEHDISYLTTREVFDNYLEYRRRFTVNGEHLLSVRMLNSVIRKYFPRARVNHSNKSKKNTYFWVFDYTDEDE